MRKYFIILVSLLSTFSNANIVEKGKQQDKHCREIMAMAMAVMMSRQNGLSLADALINTDRMANEKKATENEVFILRGMLRDAYDEPKFSSESYKQDKIDEFSSKYYLACREGMDFMDVNE